MEDKKEQSEDALMLKELLKTWKKNNKERKEKDREIIMKAVDAMMLPLIQKIIDKNEDL